MVKFKSIGTKLNLIIALMLMFACIIITWINYAVASRSLENQLNNEHLPAMVSTILAEVDKKLLEPASGLSLIANNGLFKEWILSGEPEDRLPLVYNTLQATADHFQTKGANFVSWNSKNYFKYNDGKEGFRKITEGDTWFTAFKESGKDVIINVYINHKEYGAVAFINRRIESTGSFLGLVAVALNLDDFVNRVVSMTVGEKGNTFMTDKTGLIQLHKQQKYIGSMNIKDFQGWDTHAVKALSEEDYAFTSKDENGSTTYVLFQYIPELDWYLVVQANKDELMSDINSALGTTVLVTVILLVVCIGFGVFFTSRTITQPVNETVARLKDIATGEGDLTMRLPVKTSDEIGQLSTWFNTFLEKLQGIISDITENSKSLDNTSKDVLSISNEMTEGTEKMASSSNTVAAAAEEMSSNMTSVAAAIEESSTNISMVSAAAEEMTSTINEIAKNTEKTKCTSQKAVERTENASKNIELLSSSAKEIWNVVETISDISDQTNLLALNATIEAARAGEAGKGFAVVANEIKDLAGQTVVATQEIKAKIENIQNSTKITIDDIGAVIEDIGEVNLMVDGVAAAVEEQSATTQEIASNVGQASEGIHEVTGNVAHSSAVAEDIASDIANVNQIVNEMAEKSNRVNDYSSDLSQMSGSLKQTVDLFKI